MNSLMELIDFELEFDEVVSFRRPRAGKEYLEVFIGKKTLDGGVCHKAWIISALDIRRVQNPDEMFLVTIKRILEEVRGKVEKRNKGQDKSGGVIL